MSSTQVVGLLGPEVAKIVPIWSDIGPIWLDLVPEVVNKSGKTCFFSQNDPTYVLTIEKNRTAPVSRLL